MPQFKYLVVGGGMTADSAVHGIRELDSDGSIGLISAEADPPYNRPPLSKGLWKGDAIDGIWRDTADQGVQMFLGRTARSLDPAAKQVSDDQGATYTYEKLLIATGGAPRRFAFGGDDIVYFRTLADYRRLRAMADAGRRIGVIGGGFIGSEIAAGLAMNGKQVVMFMLEGTLNGDRYPADMGKWLNDYYTQKGVEVVPHTSIIGLQKRNGQYAIQSNAGKEWLVDCVVAGLGIIPNVDLAKAVGLAVDNGIVVDEYLRTANPDIYAAGDVAAAYQRLLDKRVRVEHEDNANQMGRAAGRNMAGANEAFDYMPFFYSDLFDLGYEAVGELAPALDKFADWKDPYREGVIYYMKDGRVRGVILWNVWGKVDEARRLMAEPGPFKPDDLKGRITG